MPFALLAAPLTLMAIGAVDYGRATMIKTGLQDALDAATLTVGRSTATDPAAIQSTGSSALAANLQTYPNTHLDTSSFVLSNNTVQASAQLTVTPIIANIFSGHDIEVTATSQVVRGISNLEVAMVLDNTGSMNQTLGSGTTTKIAALKTAADSMVDELSNASTHSGIPGIIKMSLVPYTMTVNVGSTYANAAWLSPGLPAAYGSDVFSVAGTNRLTLFSQLGVTWGGCVESRPAPYDVTEAPPTAATPGTLYVPYFAPDEPGSSAGSSWNGSTWNNNYLADGTTSTSWSVRQANVAKYNTHTFINSGTSPVGYQYGPNAGCSIQPLTRLTTDFPTIKTAINAMTVGGDTDIKAGLMWGWHTLSPNAPFADGVPYGTAHTDKIMVLMTDGQNHNVTTSNSDASIYSGIGYIWQNRIGLGTGSTLNQRITTLDQKLAAACANAKNAGIIMYIVVLVDPTVDQSTVEACASSNDKLYLVSDTSQLTGVFNSIAASIENLRISQ
jgi:Flp pilus assembly protein TadG